MFHKTCRICWLAERLLVSRRFCSNELAKSHICYVWCGPANVFHIWLMPFCYIDSDDYINDCQNTAIIKSLFYSGPKNLDENRYYNWHGAF